MKAAVAGTAFRKSGRRDLEQVFSIQTERVVDKDNTVAIGKLWWQIEKCRWRTTLAGQTVSIHQHLDGAVTIWYGPHLVARYPEGRGNDVAMENQKLVFHSDLEIASGDSHIPTARKLSPLSPKARVKRVA